MPGRGKEHWHQGCSTVKENIMCEAIYHFPLKPYKNIYFSVRGYLPLILKDSITHMHGLVVYVKEGLPFAWDLSLENCRFLLMFSTGFTSFSSIDHLLCLYAQVLILFHLT